MSEKSVTAQQARLVRRKNMLSEGCDLAQPVLVVTFVRCIERMRSGTMHEAEASIGNSP